MKFLGREVSISIPEMAGFLTIVLVGTGVFMHTRAQVHNKVQEHLRDAFAFETSYYYTNELQAQLSHHPTGSPSIIVRMPTGKQKALHFYQWNAVESYTLTDGKADERFHLEIQPRLTRISDYFGDRIEAEIDCHWLDASKSTVVRKVTKIVHASPFINTENQNYEAITYLPSQHNLL